VDELVARARATLDALAAEKARGGWEREQPDD
jgi:hypothetical protein